MTRSPDQPVIKPTEQDEPAARPIDQHKPAAQPAEPAARPAEQLRADAQPAEQLRADARPAEQLRADARQNRARLIAAATAAFAEKGADAPLEDIARRAGVGIGTLYRHFPGRLDLQAAVFRSQVRTVCNQGDALLATDLPAQAFAAWVRALAGYLVTKRGLSHALIEAVGAESELIKSCWLTMRETTERLLENAQRAGVIRSDVTPMDVMRLVHGVAVSSERDPDRTDLLLSVTLDGLAATPAQRG